MYTLVIHPRDLSTDFLKPIYHNISEVDIVTHGWNDEDVLEGLEISDRALMMGHGSPRGLFSIGNFYTQYPYIIGAQCVDYLLPMEENVYIWCNADKFVIEHSLPGFFTGMFISEVAEALYCGVNNIDQDMVDESNDAFAEILGSCINENKHEIYKYVRSQYGKLTAKNPVALYNWKRLYVK